MSERTKAAAAPSPTSASAVAPATAQAPAPLGLVKPILVVVAFVILCGLGTWQVQRLHWKEALLATIAERMAAAPVPLAEIERLDAAGTDIEYRTVTVSGTFDNARERHFFATHDGDSGFFVYAPLTTADGHVVFVNRGFVPYDRKDASTRPKSLPKGEVNVTGLARTAPPKKPSFLVPENDIAKNIFYWKDLSAMAKSTGLDGDPRLEPFFIDADATPNAGGLPVGGVTIIDLPNNHLQYALTWYGLAAALLAVSVVSLMRRRRANG